MESLSDDVLGTILGRVSNGKDRKSCSKVCTLWSRIESLTRTHVRVLDPQHLHKFLPKFPNLTTVVACDRVSDQSLTFVGESCPNLRTLQLAALTTSRFRRPFGDHGLLAVARGCPRLVELSLLSVNVGDKGIMALQKYAKALTVLHLLCGDMITDTSLAAIGNMESISDLHLQDCPNITDNGLNLLSSGPASRSLRVLTICYCDEITDVGVLHLRRMSGLEELALWSYSEVTDVGGVAVSDFSNLKKLDLSWQEFVGDETLFAVARSCHNLVDIKLAGCARMTDRGLVSLASSLRLERIDISGVRGSRERSPQTVMKIAKRCRRSLKHMIVDKELKEGLSRSQLKKLSRGLCRVEWV